MEESIGDYPNGDQESQSKVELKFNLYGQILKNKNAYKTRCLALAKVQIGVTYDDWRNVPLSKKEDIFSTLKPRGENGKGPDRTEVYLEARKQKKMKKYHPNVESTAEKLLQLQSSQVESNEYQSLDNDALTQILGKDSRGRTRGVGSHVSRTTLMASLPACTELERVKQEVQLRYDKTDAKMDKMSSIDHLISLHQGKESGGPFVGRNRSSEESSLHMEALSTPTNSASNAGVTQFYNVRDTLGKKTIAIATIDSKAQVGTLVH